MLAVSAALCMNVSVFSQSITLDTGNVTVKEAIEQLKKTSGYSFVFSSADLNTEKSVSISAQNASIEEVVEQILKGQKGLSYEIQGKSVVIRKATPLTSKQKGKQVKVTGKVVDKNGEPVIGASIKEEGTSNGTITDLDGNFSLEVTNNAMLEVSFIGFKPERLQAQANKTLMITMREDTELLDEVVVIGYGTQRKGDVTSAVASVKADNFIKGAVKDVGQLIQGKVAGLAITNPSGDPAGSTQIRLRGTNTIGGANTNPLVLIDGVPGDLSTVAPEDVESVDVLKDGSAAAIYGTRGTNGVILITTKQAKGGDICSVDYSGYVSTSMLAKKTGYAEWT